jgi:hypothetical protein
VAGYPTGGSILLVDRDERFFAFGDPAQDAISLGALQTNIGGFGLWFSSLIAVTSFLTAWKLPV